MTTEHTEDDGWIQTYLLRKVYPLRPEAEQIHLLDIAHALSNQCRYTGHVHHFFSVAQHSVMVSRLAERLAFIRTRSYEASREAGQGGLLHDGSEAYLLDLARPVKHLSAMAPYREAEARLQAMIFRVFGLPEQELAVVKEADRIVGAYEARHLFPALHPDWKWQRAARPDLDALLEPFQPVGPEEAKRLFLERFEELGPWKEGAHVRAEP